MSRKQGNTGALDRGAHWIARATLKDRREGYQRATVPTSFLAGSILGWFGR